MKHQQFYGLVGLFCTLLSLCVHAWTPVDKVLAGAALGGIVYVCGAGNIPACAIVAGAKSSPVKRDTEYTIYHDTGNGIVKPFLDVESLVVGVDHDVWDNEGNTFRASLHESGDPMLSIDLSEAWEPPNSKRSTGKITSFTITYNAAGSYGGTSFTRADATAASKSILTTYSTGQGNHVCASLDQSDGSAIFVNFSFTPISNSGIHPRSGFAACAG